MSNRLPIRTYVEGDKITKICVEDVYKLLNRLLEPVNKSYSEIDEILDSCHQECDGYEGEFIVGRGISQPCDNDSFDKEIGNEIAFRKAKLNANVKKFKLVYKIYKALGPLVNAVSNELIELSKYMSKDVEAIRKYNPQYLNKTFDGDGYLYM